MPFESQKLSWGPYTADYNNGGGSGLIDMGLIEGVRRVQQTAEGTDIRSDLFGESVIDGIYQGANVFVITTFKLWKNTVQAALGDQDYLWPFAAMGDSGVHGRSMHDISGAMVMTAVTGTTAKTFGPLIRTFPNACYSPKHTSEHVMGSAERDILIVFRVYPTADGDISLGKLNWFTDTVS